MTAVVRLLTQNHSSYDPADLVRMRRDNLQYARSLPLGPERNQHRQIAASLRSLLNDADWLDAHTFKKSRA
jgi:hypothetical protein